MKFRAFASPFRSFRSQLILSVALVHALMMSLFIWDLVSRQEDMLFDQQIEQAESLARSLATVSSEWLAARDIAGMQELVELQLRYPELIFAMLTTRHGRVLAHTDDSKLGLRVLDLPETPKFLKMSASPSLVDIAAPVVLNGAPIGWARVGLGQRRAQRKLDAVLHNGILYALAAILIGSMLAWIMANRILRRIYVIQNTIVSVEAGGKESRSRLDDKDEVGHLATEFDAMLDSMSAQERELRRSEEDLRRTNDNLEAMVTERTQQLSNSLALMEKRELELKAAQRMASIGSWTLDIPAGMLHWSEESYRIFGVEAGAPVTMDIFVSFIHPEDREEVVVAWTRALSGAPYNIEHRIVTADATKWVHENATIQLDDAGRPVSGIGTVQDITERKKAAQELKKSQERLEIALQGASMGVWSWEIETDTRELDAQACRLLGLDAPFFRGTTEELIDFIHPEDRRSRMETLDRALQENIWYEPEYRVVWPDGSIHHLAARGKVTRDETGVPRQLNGTIWDITLQKENETRLQELAAIVEYSEDAIISETLKGVIVSWNRGAEKLFGYSPDEAIGRSIEMILPTDRPDEDQNLRAHIAAGNAVTDFESVRRDKDGGTLDVAVTISPLRNARGEVIGASKIVRDITELKENEKRFRTIIDASPVPLSLSDTQGQIIYVNPAFTETFGYTQQETPTLDDWWPKAFPDPSYREDVKHRWQMWVDRAERSQTAIPPLEVQIRCKDGSARTILASSVTVGGFAEKTSLVTLFDVSQITSISERLQTILATASDGIHILNEQGDLIEYSESFARMLGYSTEEMSRTNISQWDISISRSDILPTIQELMDTPTTFETRHRRKNGEIIDVEINAKGINLDGQRFVYASSRDITDRKKNLLALAASEERFNLVVAGSNDGIWDWQIPADKTYWSPRFKEILGYRDDEITPGYATWESLLHPEDKEHALATLETHFQGHDPFDVEYRMRRKDGEYLWIRARGLVVFDAQGTPQRITGSIKDIHEQKIAEFRLQEALAFNDTILKKSLVAMGVYRQDGQCVLANEALAALVGTTTKQALTHNFRQIESWKETGLQDACIAALEDGLQRRHEMHAVSSFGKELWASVLILPTLLNKEPHLVVQLIDESEIKQANKELNFAMRRLTLATQVASLGIWVWEFTSNKLNWDQRMCELYAVPESVRTSGLYIDFWRSRCHPDDLQRAEAELSAAIKDAQDFDSVFRIVLPDNSIKFIHVTAMTELEENGSPLRMIGTNQDITQQKQAEAAILESKERLEAAASAGIIGVWDWDLKNDSLYWDSVMHQLFDVPPEEFTGTSKSWADALLPEDREETLKYLQEALQGKRIFNSEFRITWRDGSIHHIKAGSKVIFDEKGQAARMIGVNYDLTEQKQTEIALNEAKAKAESANQLKSDFLANMSHEIRTPMNAVLGLAQLLLDTELNTLQRDYLDKMRKSSESLLGIINDILDYSKIEAGKLRIETTEFDLAELLDATAKLFSYSAEEKGLELIFDIDPDLPPMLMGDPLRLRQVLNNLLGNAVKFTLEGNITLRMKALSQQDNRLDLQVSVNDTGIGMTPEQVDRLFAPFEQADSSTTRRFGGTGLGLAICKRLVELMGGTITVRSQSGSGSTFTFDIPMDIADFPLCERSAADLRGMRTLVVEDNDISGEMLLAVLNSWKFDVQIATSGEQGLQMALDALHGGRPFELILVVWKMPGMDGAQMAQALRAEETADADLHKPALVIMVTAYGRQQALEAIRKVEFNAVLDKPIIASQLYNVIAGLQGEAPDRRNLNRWSTLREAQNRLKAIHGAHVLLVEDNPTNQLIAKDMLTKMGLKVSLAQNGLEAVAEASQTRYDAILMDLQMPEMDGVQATCRIRDLPEGMDIPIIAMTAAAMEADKKACLDAGMADFVAKPIDVDLLAAALLRWIPSRTASSDTPVENDSPLQNRDENIQPFSIEGLHLAEATRRIGNDWNLMRQALQFFAYDFREFPQEFNTAVEKKLWKDAHRMAHNIKGASRVIGAERLAACSKDLEDELTDAHYESWDCVRTELARVLAAIDVLPEPEPIETSAVDTAQFEKLVLTLLDDLRNARFVPPEQIQDVCTQLAALGRNDLSDKLKQRIEAFDYAAACDILTDIVKSHEFGFEEGAHVDPK